MISLKENGMQPRIHGNKRRLPHHALSYKSRNRVVTFLTNYAEQNALVNSNSSKTRKLERKGAWKTIQNVYVNCAVFVVI